MSRIIPTNSRFLLIGITLMLVMLVACGVPQTGDTKPNDFPPPPPTATPASATPNPSPVQRPATPTASGTTNVPPTPRARRSSVMLVLMGFYDPQDQSAAAVEFRRRVARFERETNRTVAYEAKPQQDINLIIKTYLVAGVPFDVGVVLPEDIADLAEAGTLAQLDRLSPNQRWPQQSSPAGQACVVEGKRYCVADDQGMAWIIPKSSEHPSDAVALLAALLVEQ
jgi:ABC-type glycerol-3-phosphate transport system substrate-binding protein